jgi:ABC-type transport system involved in multi-copper enzyme maturation permease subunit
MLGRSVLVFDAVRTARRSRLWMLRSLYALVLLAGLFVVCLNWFGLAGMTGVQTLHPNEQARFAASVFQTFLVVQYLVVLLLTPALTAGALAEERERGTLPLLLATQLEGSHIVLGKLLSRVGQLVLLLLAGLPVLALLQLLGGVDPALLVAGFVITLLTLVSTASVSLFCSASAGRTHDAVFATYASLVIWQFLLGVGAGLCMSVLDMVWRSDRQAMVLVICFVGSPSIFWTFLALVHYWSPGKLASDLPLFLLGQVLGHGLLSWFFLRRAAHRLRSHEAPAAFGSASPPKVEWHPPRPKVGECPVLWKELHAERGILSHVVGRDLNDLVVCLGMCLAGSFGVVSLVFLAAQVDRKDLSSSTWLIGTVFVPLFAGLVLVRLGLRAASCLSSERERQTLDSLRVVLAMLLAVGLCFGGVSLLGLPFLMLSVVTQGPSPSVWGCTARWRAGRRSGRR